MTRNSVFFVAWCISTCLISHQHSQFKVVFVSEVHDWNSVVSSFVSVPVQLLLVPTWWREVKAEMKVSVLLLSTSAQPRHCTSATRINANTSCCLWRCCMGTAPTLGSFSAKESRSSPNLPRRNSPSKMQIVSCRRCQTHAWTRRYGNPVWASHFPPPFSSVYSFRDQSSLI